MIDSEKELHTYLTEDKTVGHEKAFFKNKIEAVNSEKYWKISTFFFLFDRLLKIPQVLQNYKSLTSSLVVHSTNNLRERLVLHAIAAHESGAFHKQRDDIKYAGSLGWWDGGLIDQASDVPSIFFYNFLQNSLQKSFQFISLFFYNFT